MSTLSQLNLVPFRSLEVAAGAFLFHQGDMAESVHEVERGKVALLRHTRSGDSVVLFTAGSGECVNEPALFSSVYHCSARALSASRVSVFRKADVWSSLREDPARLEGFTGVLARQVRDLRARLELRSIRSAAERLYQYLLLESDAETSEVRLRSTLKQVAREIGLSHEAVYRAAAALEREGRIERRSGRILL